LLQRRERVPKGIEILGDVGRLNLPNPGTECGMRARLGGGWWNKG
jgi:hypothetical protein